MLTCLLRIGGTTFAARFDAASNLGAVVNSPCGFRMAGGPSTNIFIVLGREAAVHSLVSGGAP